MVNGNRPSNAAGLGALGQTGNFQYCVCGLRKGHLGLCRPRINPSSRPARSFTTWRLPRMGHGFPRRAMDITPQEELYDHERILGGSESCVEISPPGRTVLQQPRLETSAYRMREGFIPSEYRVLEPLLEKFQHIYPRFDSETLYVTNCADAPPIDPGPPPRPTPVAVITFDTPPGLITYIKHIDVTVLDGLMPANMGTSVTVDGVPIKFIVQPTAATSPPTYGVQPQTPNFPIAVGMPFFQNDLIVIPDRKRVIVQAGNFDPIATREVCISVWGWVTPFVTYGR